MMKISESNANTIDLHKEAKSMVLQELESAGVIARMKAQIKNSVLKVLEKQKQPVKNNLEFDYMTPLHRMNKTKEVLLAYHIIKEFMQFFELEYTLPIFENETNIKENIKRETLLNELFSINNQTNISALQTEPKPVLIQLISNYLQEMQNKKNAMENVSQKLDESYGVKNPHYSNLENLINKDVGSKSMGGSLNKKQLAPISFVNKSVDMKETASPSNKDLESMKFNTANISDIYSQSSLSSKSFNLDNNKNSLKDNQGASKSDKDDSSPIGDNYKFQFNTNEYGTNQGAKYDDEFNEVILEEINEGKHPHKGKEDDNEVEDSKKSLTASGLNFASSMGYDSSVTNYKLEEFDHVEEVEKPM